jgi:hypothetical protein
MESTNNAESVSTSQDAANAAVMSTGAHPADEKSAPVKLPESRVFVQVHSTDVEAIRAVLALKPPQRKGFPTGLWIGVALVLLVAAFGAWQWTVSTTQTAENIAPPQIMTPKPPDFAFQVAAPNPPAQPQSYKAHPRRGRSRSNSGN